MVVIHHLQPVIGHGEGLVGRGFLAVDFFFVLSGFVVACAYDRSLKDGMRFLDFARIRLIRLYPLIFAGVMVGVAVTLVRGDAHQFWLALLSQLLLIPGLAAGSTLFLLNSVHWSLFFELVANFGHALTFRWVGPRLLTVGIVLAGLALVAAGIKMHYLGGGWGPQNWWVGLLRVAYSYPLGVLMYRAHAAGRLPGVRLPFVAVAALLVGVLVLASVIGDWRADIVMILIAFPAIVAIGVRAPSPARPLVAEQLGALSYPLYAIHSPIVDLWTERAPHGMLSAGVALLTCVVLALIAGRCFDQPVRRWIAGRLAPFLKPRSAI